MLKVFHPNYANTKTNKPKIGGESAQSINMWAEWACTMEDGILCSSFSAKILHKYGQINLITRQFGDMDMCTT